MALIYLNISKIKAQICGFPMKIDTNKQAYIYTIYIVKLFSYNNL